MKMNNNQLNHLLYQANKLREGIVDDYDELADDIFQLVGVVKVLQEQLKDKRQVQQKVPALLALFEGK